MLFDFSRTKYLKPEQQKRIGHRYSIVIKLTKLVERSQDPVFIERANWIIEQKRHEIEAIMSLASPPPPRSP